jgi:receptor protein-tyrosine kinase
MSIIEQAVKRLDELKQAGVEIPDKRVEPVDASTIERAAALGDALPEPPRTHAEAPAHPGQDISRRVDIDLERLARAGFVSSDVARSRVADEFRVIKRPIIANAIGKGAAPIHNGNLVMVTSAFPGEGKSFTALNLAMSIAMELDNTVLLVDADVARPSVLNLLGLPPAKGLMDILLEPSLDLSQVLLRTNIEKLTILPAGMSHQRATELLASDGMARLVEEMASRYPDRIIIFDSPPLLVTTEARVLASHMGQIVLVVEAERTSHASVKQALTTVEACPVKLMTLNKARHSGDGGYYGYGYGYGYGGYSYGAASASRN